uniref:Calcium-binding mitochondrial carrier protein SCaMC-1 n=1 Tax=Loa loa TaxID=7209 RepID=A0A1I7VAG1_LOALO
MFEIKYSGIILEGWIRLSEFAALSYGVPAEISIPRVNEDKVFMFHLNMHGISKEKERRLRELYERLDMNGNGIIDIRDLTNALKHSSPHIPNGVTPVKFFGFKLIGYVGVQEIKKYCDDLGLPISETKAQEIVEWMARTNSASVNFSEFKDFMLLYPRSKPDEIAKLWKHNLVIDIGEDSQIPKDFSQQEITSGFWWKHLVAGGVAGGVSRTCTAPLDRVKIYLQVHATLLNRLRFPKAAKLLYEEGGLKSFWRGNGVNIAKIAPESAIKFLSYDVIKRLIVRERGEGHKLQISERFAAGSAAGVVSQTIIYPLEVLKTRLALRHSSQLESGLVDLAAKMYRNEGFISFYKGIVPNLIGIIPYAGIDLAIYETLKNYYVNNYNAYPVRDIVALPVCGACSSICGILASYPFALVRTRLQALAMSGNLTQPDTMNGQIKYIWRNDGLYGFYRGLTANLVKAVPAVAISYYVYEHMRSVRDTGVLFPSTLSNDEKRLKEVFEKLRSIRKAIAATNKLNASGTVGDNLKTERKTTKRHLQQAEEATEEVKRKVLIGAVSFKKADERKDSFKRSSLVGRRRVNNSNTELLPLNADDGFDTYKPLSSNDHSETKKKMGEPSDGFDTFKPPYNPGTCKSAASDVTGIPRPGSSSTSRTISPVSDNFDTYKTREGENAFDNYRPIGVRDNADFDTNLPSTSFDVYKPTSVDDGFDTYKPTQSFSFDASSGSSPFVGFEQPKPCRGPCLYIRGYDLVADSLRNVFSKYGAINRVFVEERQKSAFITYATTEEAEVAIKEMDGNMVNGITLRVSFARRQNQCGDSGRFRSSKSFDRNNDGDDRSGGDRSNRSRGERSTRFRSNERIRFRGRGRGRGRMCEGGNSLVPPVSTENNDDFWSGANKASNDGWSTAEPLHDKGDFWPSGRQSPERTSGRPSVGRDNKEEDDFDTYKSSISSNEKNDFDTYKSTISANEKDDFVNKKDDDFDTYKPSNNDGRGEDSSTWSWETADGNYQENFGKRHDGSEHPVGERRGGFANDRYRSFGGDGRRGNGMPRRGNRNRGGTSWRSRRRNNELKGDDCRSASNLNVGRKSSWLTKAESGDKYDFWTSGDRHSNAPSKSDSDNRENESQEKSNDKDDFWPTSSHQSSCGGDESWSFPLERSGEDQSFQGNTRGDYKSGRRGGDRGGGFRRQRRNFDSKSAWPDGEEDKSSYCAEWPDVDSKLSMVSWPTPSDDKVPNSPPPPPPMSEVQVAWSEATKKTSKEMATATKKRNSCNTAKTRNKDTGVIW